MSDATDRMLRSGTDAALPDLPIDESLPRLLPLAEARSHVVGVSPFGAPPGAALGRVREAALELRSQVVASGRPDGVTTRSLVTQPHPAGYALPQALRVPARWVWLTDRMVVVSWHDDDGPQVLLWGPADHEQDTGTDAMQELRRRLPLARGPLRRVHGTVPGHLRALGVDPLDVTWVVFDHLHTQDLRRLVGTGPDAVRPVEAWLPNARVLVQRAEWETLRHPHPLQSRWYQPDTYAEVDHRRLVVVDGDHLLGPGVAVVATPGHTAGNQSLVLHTDRGVQVVSGNGVLAESWAPASSRLPGVRRWALDTSLEVVPRASTLEYASWQYTSMVAEAALPDRTPDGRFPAILPTGELSHHPLAPRVRPTHVMGGIEHGRVLPSRAVPGQEAGAS